MKCLQQKPLDRAHFMLTIQRLTRLHRLGHHARVAYTLFLKEIGLSYEEALKFWAHHYSRASTPSASVSW